MGGVRRDRAHAAQRSSDDETLLVQSGKPVGVFRTHEWAPRVLIANSNLVPEWATWDEFRRLEDLGLTMYGQMTAGSWIYIGSQGIVQGTYECFAEIARRRHGGSLAGTITLTAGLGGMGGAQPLAVTMNGGVALCVEIDRDRIERRIETRYLDEVADDLETRSPAAAPRSDERRALSVGLCANAADVLPEVLARGLRGGHRHRPDERARPARRLRAGPHVARRGGRAARARPRRVRAPLARLDRRPLRGDGRLPRPRRRGLRLRQQPARGGELGGFERAFAYPGFVPAYMRPLFCGAGARSAGWRCPATPPTSPPPTARCWRSSAIRRFQGTRSRVPYC